MVKANTEKCSDGLPCTVETCRCGWCRHPERKFKQFLKRLVCRILGHKFPEPKNLIEFLSDKKCLRCGYVDPFPTQIIPKNVHVQIVEGANNKPVFVVEDAKEESTICLEHHWGSNGRCHFCQMQRRYYSEAMAMLDSWPAKEKETQEWKDKVKSIKECKPHIHEDL